MVNKIIRWFLTIIGGAIGYAIAFILISIVDITFSKTIYRVLAYVGSIAIFSIIFYLSSNFFIDRVKKLADSVDIAVRKLNALDVIMGTIGLVIGLLISALLVTLISKIQIPVLSGVLSVLTYIVITLITTTIAIRRIDDVRKLIGNIKLKGVEVVKNKDDKKSEGHFAPDKYLDTSVIIDGRILDIMRTGFIDGNLLIPSFVLEELQFIADSSDSQKRQRGRHGLDILGDLREEFPSQVRVVDLDKDKKMSVDIALLEVANKNHGVVMTNDYNLNKVATVRNITVLNINDLSGALRPVVLPGESLNISITQEGKELGQGVGFLNDGTMVVVENGKEHVNKVLDVIVTSVLQTSAGRMIFAKLKQDEN